MAGNWEKKVADHHCYPPSAYNPDYGIGSIWRCECGKPHEVVGKQQNPAALDPREPYTLNIWRESTIDTEILSRGRD